MVDSIDVGPNSRGAMVVRFLRVRDICKALGCSRSYAYQVIKECRGEEYEGIAFVLPSELQAWAERRTAGAPTLTDVAESRVLDRDLRESRRDTMKKALRQEARVRVSAAPRIKLTMPKTKPLGET